MFSNKMLYIPDYVVYENIATIIDYFDNFNIAKVKEVKVYPHSECEYYTEQGHNYGYALIEIDYYYDNQGARNFYTRIENGKGLMVYDDPLYWVVQFDPNTVEHKSPYTGQCCDTNKHITPLCQDVKCLSTCSSSMDYNNEEECYYSSDDDKNDDYSVSTNDSYNYDSYNYDSYNYDTYINNFNRFKDKQKVKKQKLKQELFEIKKSINSINNAYTKLVSLLIINNNAKTKAFNNKQKNNKVINTWTRRLRNITTQ